MQRKRELNPSGGHTPRLWRSVVNHWSLALCLLLYLTVTILYSLTVPIFETPDANGHYAYIHELTEGRGLPVQGEPSGSRVTGYVASHPPLYYALCAALSWWVPDDVDFEDWAWRNPHQTMGDPDRTANKNILVHTSAEEFPWRGTPLTMHIARLVSTLLGALAVAATYAIALELFPQRRWLALGATSLVAFNPMFVFTGARVSNDAAVAAFASLSIWGAVRLVVKDLSRRGLVLTGTALGLAVLSKLSGLVLAPVVALALLVNSLHRWDERSEESWQQKLSALMGRWALVGLTVLAVTGWWFARNVVLYDELMGVEAWLSHTATVRSDPIGVLDVVRELSGLEKSYWAMFGWFNVAVAPWMYRFWWVLVRAAFLALGLVVVDQVSSRRLTRRVQWGLVILVAAVLLNFGSVWRFIMTVLGAQGRYLMPVVAPISILLMLGLGRLVPRALHPSRWRYGLAALIGVTHVVLTLICLVFFILPAYAKPAVVTEDEIPEAMTRLDLSFEGTPVVLLGGQVEAESVSPGDRVSVSLYWRAREPSEQDYVAFLQILGREMEPIAGVDCYPGAGTFPPTLWEPGVVYRDRYHLAVAADALSPTAGVLHAGLYTEEGERLSIRRSADQPLLDLALLDRVAVRPHEPVSADIAHRVNARFGESITLVGYDISDESVKRGDAVTVTLVWHTEAALDTDYTAFVHLIDSDADLVVQSDHPPLNGAYPTSLWKAGDVVRDLHRLTIDHAAASGACTLSIGMYNPETNERLPAYKERNDTRFKDDIIVVGGVTIE